MDCSTTCTKKQTLDDDYSQLSREDLLATIHRLGNTIEQLKQEKQNGCSIYPDSEAKKAKRNIDFAKYNKRHIALKILYLGWDYDGFVIQDKNVNTIEYHLFSALLKGCLIESRETSNYHRCGRTDQGVSSFSQVVSLTVRSRLTDNQLDNELPYCKILNGILPNDIRIIAWASVLDSFSARFSCKMRTYKYWFPRGDLDVEKMNEAIHSVVGSHDFRNLCKMDVANGVVDFHRFIHLASVKLCSKNHFLSQPEFDICELTIVGEAFLWHQIRAIVSILFLVGCGKENNDIFEKLLDVENHPRKPQYALSSALPLNLFHCEFENIDWIIDQDSLTKVISTLQSYWTSAAVKTCMLENMLQHCRSWSTNPIPADLYSTLFKDVNSKTYKPLLSRPTAQSLEDRISHYIKKGKLHLKPAM